MVYGKHNMSGLNVYLHFCVCDTETERDDWYLYGKELLEYDQNSAWLYITEYE